jgi:hypothetical protein
MAFNYDNCTKDQLDEYASTLGITLDMRKSLANLIEDVKKAEPKPDKAIAEAGNVAKEKPRWLRHPKNGRIFEYTDALFEYGLIPCKNPKEDFIDSTAKRVT